MGDYTRATRECRFAELRPELAAAIRLHIEKYELGASGADGVICCETVSRRKKAGLIGRMFGGTPGDVLSAVFVTPVWFIWVSSDQKLGTTVLSARLTQINVRDYDNKLVPDFGLDVSGSFTDSPKRIQVFIGLEEGAAGESLRTRLKEVIQQAGGQKGS
jgi:hypothetical protein